MTPDERQVLRARAEKWLTAPVRWDRIFNRRMCVCGTVEGGDHSDGCEFALIRDLRAALDAQEAEAARYKALLVEGLTHAVAHTDHCLRSGVDCTCGAADYRRRVEEALT